MGSDPVYNYPSQPSYGESLGEALQAQVNLLRGTGAFEGTGGLKELTEKYEKPLRQSAAQIDTDVLRQTILGDAEPQTARLITQADVDSGFADAGQLGQPGIKQVRTIYEKASGNLPPEAQTAQDQYALIERHFNGEINAAEFESQAKGLGMNATEINQGVFGAAMGGPTQVAVLNEFAVKMNAFADDIADAGGKLIEEEVFTTTNPQTGEAFKEGQVVRAGEGMVDLLGDTRGVQESVKGEDYAQYVQSYPDLEKDFNAKKKLDPSLTIEEYGQRHYERHGRAKGREMPTSYSLQDAGRQAGFDELGRFMGLSALAEDIGRGGQQRSREADIADVERLGGRATEAYRAQGDLGGALETARAMGAGGSDNLSAIPANPLFSGDATGNLADRARAENLGISAISGGRMGDYDPLALAPAPVEDFRATIEPSAPMVEYQPPRSPTPTISAPRRTDAAQSTSYSFTNPAGQGSAGGGGGGGGSGSSSGAASLALQGPVQPGQPALGAPATAQPQQAQYAQPGGTDAFRSALMQQGMGALDQGITARESRAIQEAARARATNMGRTFDQTASIKEAEDVIREDNARRMQNRAFAQSALGQEVGIQQADLARGLQAQQLEMARQTAGADRQLTAEEKDIERAMRRGAMEEQFRQSGLGAERASAAQMVGLEQATSADPFQAILQRQGQNNLGAGGQLFGSAQYGLQSGPQYLNPEAGLGFISNQATNAANMFGAQQMADATTRGGVFGGLGSLAGGLFGGAGAAKGFGNLFCWVAREVYGAHNPAWLDFRHWMFSSAPRWFFKLYLTFGERFANFISNKPRLKARIRLWMDSKIGR